jgi:hypothetical protein
MKLVVSGMVHDSRTQFKHLWGRYILGFKPWTHCLNCFVTHKAKGVLPTMVDGEYQLDDSFELFYLCGVGWKDRRNTNVHLAVRPRLGSVASTGSVYGVQFTITDAQAILIRYLPVGWRGLPDQHSQCKNFQFGYQMFNADEAVDTLGRQVVTMLRDGKPLRRSHSALARNMA